MLTAVVVVAVALFGVLAVVAWLARSTGDYQVTTWVCTVCHAEFDNEWDAGLHVELVHRGRADG